MVQEKKEFLVDQETDSATINKLLKQFKMMTNMMKKMSKGNPERWNAARNF